MIEKDVILATVVTLFAHSALIYFKIALKMLSKTTNQIGALSIFALLFFDAICNLKIRKTSVIDFFESPFTVKSVSGQAYFMGICYTN